MCPIQEHQLVRHHKLLHSHYLILLIQTVINILYLFHPNHKPNTILLLLILIIITTTTSTI